MIGSPLAFSDVRFDGRSNEPSRSNGSIRQFFSVISATFEGGLIHFVQISAINYNELIKMD